MLAPVVAECTTWAQVCRQLGVKPFTGAQTHLQKRCKDFGIDASHFLGQAHNKGKTFSKQPLEQHLVAGSTIKSHTLRMRLIRDGYKEAVCEVCGLIEWLGQPAPLELDHINSDHWDNRLENLQIVCPNCHAVETARRKQGAVA